MYPTYEIIRSDGSTKFLTRMMAENYIKAHRSKAEFWEVKIDEGEGNTAQMSALGFIGEGEDD